MDKTAEEAGVLHIIAFDSKYGDNAGKYEVKFRLSRASVVDDTDAGDSDAGKPDE